MAKIVKDSRTETIDVDTELKNLKKGKAKETKKEIKKDKKKKETKKVKTHKKGFLHEVKAEMDKVKWPSKKDMVKYSIATIVFVIFFALFFYAIDLVLALLKEVF